MIRKRTIGEHAWPDSPEFSSVANNWCKNVSSKLLSYVWKAYELLENNLLIELLSQTNWTTDNTEDIERSITQYLEPNIRNVMTGFETFYVQHGTYEYETRVGGNAQPPQYDIAFCLTSCPRKIWPLEAKLLETDGSVAQYIADVKQEFLTCRYAPFSDEGAMIGYLLKGTSNKAFENIGKKLNCSLTPHPDFLTYDHKFSQHKRNVPTGKSYPIDFKCHHLIFDLRSKVPLTTN